MIKGFVNGVEKDISRIPMFVNGVEKNGWEVRDSQNRLIWGRQGTIIGNSPLNFDSGDGKPLTAWSIYGNGRQTGTPTPDNPIMPEFVGVRTAQIIDYTLSERGGIDGSGAMVDGSVNLWRSTVFYDISQTGITLSFVPDTELNNVRINYYDAEKTHISRQQLLKSQASGVSLTIPENAKYFKWTLYTASSNVIDIDYVAALTLMLNSGSTALPYEPYGYKIPITCAGHTVPVYLGQTQTVRRVRKLVLTGEEEWYQPSIIKAYRITLNGYLRETINVPVCTHFIGAPPVTGTAQMSNYGAAFLISDSGNNYFYIRDDDYTTANAFKSYLAAQYAAGTPVTVWYVLANPETGIVNEPLAKIGDYVDELHSTDAGIIIPTAKGENTLTFDTAIQPSKVSISGHIK